MNARRPAAFAASAGALLFLVSHSAAMAEAGPSFDCKAARTGPEKAICASPALSALDRRVAAAYRNAMAAFDVPTQAALRTDQRYFLEARNAYFGTRDYELKSDLADRAQMLEGLDLSPRSGWGGKWVSVVGLIEIAPKGQGRQASISTVALSMSHPVCNLEAGALPDGDALVVGGSPAELEENEGWTVRLTRTGGALTAELLPPKGGDAAGGPPFCGHIPSIAGAFLPTK